MTKNRIRPPVALLQALLVVSGGGLAHAAVTGFVADFNADLHGFFSGSSLSNPSSGGVGGAADGYLETSTTAFPGNLGAASDSSDLTGDLPADGVTGYRFFLNDVGQDDALEIHVGVGQAFSNVWLSNAGFTPPEGSWGQFSVDVTDSSQWTQIIGAGSFADALANCDRLLFRHDVPPLNQSPDTIQGDFGIDRITVLPAASKVPAVTGGMLVLFAATFLASGGLLLRRRRAPGRR